MPDDILSDLHLIGSCQQEKGIDNLEKVEGMIKKIRNQAKSSIDKWPFPYCDADIKRRDA